MLGAGGGRCGQDLPPPDRQLNRAGLYYKHIVLHKDPAKQSRIVPGNPLYFERVVRELDG